MRDSFSPGAKIGKKKKKRRGPASLKTKKEKRTKEKVFAEYFAHGEKLFAKSRQKKRGKQGRGQGSNRKGKKKRVREASL